MRKLNVASRKKGRNRFFAMNDAKAGMLHRARKWEPVWAAMRSRRSLPGPKGRKARQTAEAQAAGPPWGKGREHRRRERQVRHPPAPHAQGCARARKNVVRGKRRT